jgi:hypothetical protein
MSDVELREQVKTALQFLEGAHGDALNRPWSDEAHAYYHAVDILEAALNDELKPPDELYVSEYDREAIQRSREAREEGYAAATLLHERFDDERNKPEPLLQKLKRVFA